MVICSPVEVAGTVLNGTGAGSTGRAITPALATTGLGLTGSSGGRIFLTATNSSATATSCGTTDNAQSLISSPISATGLSLYGAFANTCANNVSTIAPGVNSNGVIITNTNPLPGSGVVIANISSLTALDIGNIPVSSTIFSTTFSPAPVILSGTSDDLDIDSGRAPRQLSHKVFGHIDYTWRDYNWTPFISFIGEAEFSQKRDCCVVNQGGLIIKGGFNF